MLTKGDEYPIHQTPEPIAFSGTDRNFYDRYFFNGFNPDGSEYLGVAFAVYPHLNIADAHFSVVRDGVQHCVHASRFLEMERMDLHVGPISIEIVEPLKTLVVRVAQHEGISAELRFEGRTFPILEPRFSHRFGSRTFMDITRMTQNAAVSGWIEIDGVRRTLDPGARGTRDRSWGVRSIGVPDQQPLAPAVIPAVFWVWAPLNFENSNSFFHIMADADGNIWNSGSVMNGFSDGKEWTEHFTRAGIDVDLIPGTRHSSGARISMSNRHREIEIHVKSAGRFQMKGIGYSHPVWTHGLNQGPLKVEREDFVLAELNPADGSNLHIQDFATAVLKEEGKPDQTGFGTFEQVIVGPYTPLGFGMGEEAPVKGRPQGLSW